MPVLPPMSVNVYAMPALPTGRPHPPPHPHWQRQQQPCPSPPQHCQPSTPAAFTAATQHLRRHAIPITRLQQPTAAPPVPQHALPSPQGRGPCQLQRTAPGSAPAAAAGARRP
eukprot:1156160-Pelagomonas_calceolata.AAC.4